MKLLIAVNFDEDTKVSLHDHMKKLTDKCEKGTFTKKDNIHLSLVYIGETTQIGAVVETLDTIDSAQFEVSLSENGRFRRSGGEVYWVGIEKTPELVRLQKILYRSLVRQGVMKEKNDFKPHLTVSRDVAIANDMIPDAKFTEKLPVKRISLMKCEQGRDGMSYTEVYAKDLPVAEQ